MFKFADKLELEEIVEMGPHGKMIESDEGFQ